MIYVSVAKTSARYRRKLVFLPAASVCKEVQYKEPAQQFFFQPAADDFQVAQFGR